MPKRSLLAEVPAETARVAWAAFPKGNAYLRLRDELGVIYQESEFAELFSWLGRPEESPGLLALVLVLQFVEGLSDRQAAEAVGSRIDWKYLLGLELAEPGIDYTILGDFRERLIAGSLEMRLLDSLLERFRSKKLLKERGRQRTDSTQVLAASRQLNRLECVGETLRLALEALATVSPDWLVGQIEPDWVERYGARLDSYRLPHGLAERQALQQQIGQDGHYLLSRIYQPQAPAWLREVPAIELLRQVWLQQYYLDHTGQVHWRARDNMPANEHLIQSPHDPQARNRTKRDVNWTGYSVHLTETCDDEGLHLITHVVTVPATTTDVEVTGQIHQALADKQLLPGEHVVDMAYIDGGHLVSSHTDYGLDLVGPVPPDNSWQARANQGFAIPCFSIDWLKQQLTCPMGKVSRSWHPVRDRRGNDCIKVCFAPSDCRSCSVRVKCTSGKVSPRAIYLRPQLEHAALQVARQRQQTAEFKQAYKKRAGVEGTISQGTRSFDLRRSRYIGLAKTSLQHILIAAAMNLTRFAAYLAGTPLAKTRRSRLASLAFST
jgi:transposase